MSSSNIGIAIGGIAIGLGIAASGAVSAIQKQSALASREEACWESNTTTGLNGLATEEALPLLKASFPDDMSRDDQDAVSKSFSVQLANFNFIDESDDGGTIHCNASSSFSFTRNDGTTYTNADGNVISYTLHPALDGWSSEMTAADVPENVFQYIDAPTPPSAPQAPPESPAPVAPVAVPPEVADFDQGHADRLTWESWINGLQGPEHDGAIYWSGQRSLTTPGTCEAGAAAASLTDASSQTAFVQGCQEAMGRLAPSDVRREADPLYHAGWNAPIPAAPAIPSTGTPQ